MVGSSASWTFIVFAMTVEDYSQGPNMPTLAGHHQVTRKRQGSVYPSGWLGHISHWPQATPRQCFFSSQVAWQLLLWLVLVGAMVAGVTLEHSCFACISSGPWAPLGFLPCCCGWQVLASGGWGKPRSHRGSSCRTQWGPSGLASTSPIRTQSPLQAKGPAMGTVSFSPAF